MADDTDFDESLIENIKQILTHLSDNEASGLSKYLRDKGVRKLSKHITVNILNEKLNFIESSELYSAWQDTYGARQPSNNEPSTSTAAPPSRKASRRPLSNLQNNAQQALKTALPVFDENSPYFPSGVKVAIQAERRPSRSDRESLCERVVDHCREVVPNLERSMLNDVARQIVGHFPKSFKDTILISEHGSDSLALQLRTKFDNVERQKKRPKAPLEIEAPATKEAYCCVLWEAPLPAGETEESLEIMRVDLKKMYRISKKDWDWRIIKKKLQDSYYLQRKDINATAVPPPKKGKNKKRRLDEEENDDEAADATRVTTISVPDIKSKWPFLFTPQGMNFHFKILTNVDLKTKISSYVASEADRLIDFLARKSEPLGKLRRNMIRAEKQGLGSTKLVAAINMLICYFKEDLNYMVRFTEKTSSYEEMRETFKDLPQEKTPILVAAGDSLYNFERLFVYIDNLLVTVVKNILDGLIMVFAAHFVFNICYAEQLACFYTYLQKGIVGMTPTNGSKCKVSTTTRKANEKAVKLQNTLVSVREQEDREANEPL